MKIIDNNTVSVDVSYTEPVIPTGQSPLAYSSVYYQIGTGTPVAAQKTTAVSPAGGNKIDIPALIVPAPVGQSTSFNFWANATDLNGDVGPNTPTAVFTVNRIAPGAPTGFTVA